VKHHEHRIFHGITVSLTRRRIQKYQRRLGNGHDAELHEMIADLRRHLKDDALALQSYHAAVQSLLTQKTPLDTPGSNRLIALYKKILALRPLDEETADRLGAEYQRRGHTYRAVSLHTAMAERFARTGNYQQATDQYQRVFQLEPGSITARQTCAELYNRLHKPKRAALEYKQIGDIFFDHQKFDGALEYYQQAATLDADNEDIQHKVGLTEQILDGALIPRAQASLQKLSNLSEDTAHLQQSLAEKERIEQELRQNIQQLKQRYHRSVKVKDQQLRDTRHRFEKLLTYVAVLKDNLAHTEEAKSRFKAQLDQEIGRKQNLAHKLEQLTSLQISDQPVAVANTSQTPHVKRLETTVARLYREKTKLARQLQTQITQVARREDRLRELMATEASREQMLQQRLKQTTRQCDRMEEELHRESQMNQHQAHDLQTQLQQLLQQHEQALYQLEQQKQRYQQKYQDTQVRMNVAEQHTMSTLEHLHDELTKQYELETSFSEQFQQSLQEIATLLHDQEQEIQQLECL
jgi:myosin heavy subunit